MKLDKQIYEVLREGHNKILKEIDFNYKAFALESLERIGDFSLKTFPKEFQAWTQAREREKMVYRGKMIQAALTDRRIRGKGVK